MANAANLADLVQSAAWLAHRFDPVHMAFHLRHVPRERHAALPFLSDQHLGDDNQPLVVTAGDAAAALAGAAAAPLHFIFHSAYCASTLLVRLFDQPGAAMGLSEPQLLNDLVGWRRRGAPVADHARVSDGALRLLARPFAAGEAVVVKPSNVVNPLAPGLMVLRPQARAVLLYAPLEDFLLSVARKGLWCRLWCRELLEGYMQEGFVNLGFEPRDYFRQSDLQVAAVGWLAQQAGFARMVERFGDRVMLLDSRRLTRQPAMAAAAVARHFGLPGLGEDAFAVHPAIRRDSKSGSNFAEGQRDRELDAARAAHGDETAQVAEWARQVAITAGVPWPTTMDD